MRFPRIHLATSVVNRILDINAGIEQQAATSEPPPFDSGGQGKRLDKQLATPPQAIPAPVGSEEAILADGAQGGTAADAVGSLAALDALP